ncbi:TauD/TfdA family dioxygenase [Streptacidiphilus sp. P02-A3a]|uniref:TauD/TfdA dioxygenase family protein n=1 Tax=Streptacidiphilus sp. P02-A3a TaxID=2704468 RepID=UPI0015FCFF54|nr:TauD/TfdA family dioxygenase [Streptacidiphilus sp. P02-A3a]QMU73243.1 taurine dioxygenase [Streptacidiphilus sp. P02-A3a]
MTAPHLTIVESEQRLPWDQAGAEAGLPPADRPGRAVRGGPRRLRRIGPNQADRPYRRFGLTPLSPVIGAEVSGVDLGAPLDQELRAELRRAFLEWKVLFFRDQRITQEQQTAFARLWGELEQQSLAPGAPGPGVARYVKDAANAGFENAWHADMTGRPRPAMAFVLRLLDGPEVGGDTLFTDAGAAYDCLPAEVRSALEGLRAVHDLTATMGRFVPADEIARIREQYPPVSHPVVRTHPETGRPTLFVNSVFTDRIEGMEPERGEQLLQYLFRQLQAPEYQCRFRWTPGSVAFWDNRAVQHYAVSDYFPAGRVTERVAVAGGVPF